MNATKRENLPPNWDDIEDECQHIPLNCPWTITSEDKTLTFVITCLKWTLYIGFWIRVTAHSERNPITSNQLAFNKNNLLLESPLETLNDYEEIPEPHLNSHQLRILGDLLEFLFSEKIIPTMANTYFAYPDLAIDNFSGTDPDQDVESFIQLIERKINFAVRDAGGDAGEPANYTFRKKTLFSSLLRGPTAEWCQNNITNATTCESVRKKCLTRFSDGRNKFRYRMELEHCFIGDWEETWNFLHSIKGTVDKGWPNNVEGIAPADHGAERIAQARQRRQRYVDYSKKAPTPRYLQRKAQEYLMDNPNATWNDFSTRIIRKDVSFQVSSNLLNNEEQTKTQMATLSQEMKIFRSESPEHRVNAVEGNPRTVDEKSKRKTKCNKILQLFPHKRTYPKLVPQEDTRRRTETNRKQKDCREKSHVYSGLKQKTSTRPWIGTMG